MMNTASSLSAEMTACTYIHTYSRPIRTRFMMRNGAFHITECFIHRLHISFTGYRILECQAKRGLFRFNTLLIDLLFTIPICLFSFLRFLSFAIVTSKHGVSLLSLSLQIPPIFKATSPAHSFSVVAADSEIP